MDDDPKDFSNFRDLGFSSSPEVYGPILGAQFVASINEKLVEVHPDATSFLSTKFVTGPMTNKHDHAEGVCFHEMGHKLFYFMKYKNSCGDKSEFSKMRSCLLMNHSELSAEELLVETGKTSLGGDSKYESED